MSATLPVTVPISKGAVCKGLDKISKGQGARARLTNLRSAIAGLAPSYAGLAEVFDEHVIPAVFTTPANQQQVLDHLNTFWFDPASPQTYFPGVPVRQIYAQGVIQALDLALQGTGAAARIDAWWVLDCTEVRLVSRADPDGRHVTLDIQTPRPVLPTLARPKPPWILGDAVAYVTRRERKRVVTRRVNDIK